ncbi:MAG: threonine synthase [Ardenticatenaceae bacterium]
MIQYYSTHRQAPAVGFEEALLNGLAPDGGLYYPSAIPTFSAVEQEQLRAVWQDLRASDDPDPAQRYLQIIGFEVLNKWFGHEIEPDALQQIANDAQCFPIPIKRVGDIELLELFHGPTMAFKDVAAHNLARLMGYFLKRRGERAILLVATSGDTGGAIAHGFADQDSIEVVVLFPKGKVSLLQEEQLTRVAPNVTPIEVEGVFDDCQALVKKAFVDAKLAHLPLTSANSINVARLLPQIIYYVYTHFVLDRDDLEMIVPSGNFGNLTAGLFAKEMGIPLTHFVAATNSNDAATRYYQSGQYQAAATKETLSNAMDVGNPSNFARVLELFGHNHNRFRDGLRAYSVNDHQTIQTTQQVYNEHNYLLCPHTAVGWRVATEHSTPGKQPVVIATASPTKFANEIEAVTAIHIDNSTQIQQLQTRPKRKTSIKNEWPALQKILLEVGANL